MKSVAWDYLCGRWWVPWYDSDTDSDSDSDDDDDKMGGRRRRGSRKMRGGMYALSPSPISGIKDTSGVALQFVAGNATM